MPSLSRRQFLSFVAASPLVPPLLRTHNRQTQSCEYTYCVSNADKPLPVELVAFDVTRANDTARLQWKTETERNNAGFVVHHRPPNADWSKAGFVNGAGTAREPQSYEFAVKGIKTHGLHQFRLVQVDLDGSRTQIDPVSIRVGLEEALRLTPPFPNPTSSTASVQVGVRDGSKVVVTLYNGLGQQVATLYDGSPSPSELQTIRIESDRLASGSYFVRATTENRTRTRRLVIVH
jgi:hypothetical protein